MIKDIQIKLDKSDIRAGEIFNVSIEDAPSYSEIIWEFSDGTTSTGNRVSHAFSKSDIYEISVTAKWEGFKGEGSKEIIIKNPDQVKAFGGFGQRDLRYIVETHIPCIMEIDPGVTEPEIHICIDIENGIGKFRIRVEIVDLDTYQFDYSYSEDFTLMRSDYSFQKTLSPCDYPEIDETKSLQAVLVLDEGLIGYWGIECKIIY